MVSFHDMLLPQATGNCGTWTEAALRRCQTLGEMSARPRQITPSWCCMMCAWQYR